MDAESLMHERHVLDAETFVEIVIWRLPKPLRGSRHRFKYRLALVRRGVCVLRYNNETGEGDHRHAGDMQEVYVFRGADTLLVDFWRDVEKRRVK